MDIQVEGMDQVLSFISKIQSPQTVFDTEFAKNARQTTRQMIIATPKKTGITAKGWSLPVKIAPSHYVITNKMMTPDKKHSLITILEKGRGEVRPIHAKKLYIPLTSKGASKPYGGAIPKDFVYGKDYILAKKSKPTHGKYFVETGLKTRTSQLLSDIKERYSQIQNGI